MQRQIDTLPDGKKKGDYENRLDAFIGYQGIENVNIVNPESTRYEFLMKLLSDSVAKGGEFYIVEANESGVKVNIRTFVIYLGKKEGEAIVDTYIFNKIWLKFRTETRVIPIKSGLKSHFAVNGVNYEDIIISYVKNSKIVESEFFLYGTLSASSSICQLVTD